MKNKKNQQPFDEAKFEAEVHNSLNYFGYIFPETTTDVERFEELYGDTEIETPSAFDILSKKKHSETIDFNILNNQMGMAAYAPDTDPLVEYKSAESKEKDPLPDSSKDKEDTSQK